MFRFLSFSSNTNTLKRNNHQASFKAGPKTKKPHTEDPMCVVSNPHLSFAAGFSTLNEQVAGFHRAVPSTTLDKADMQFADIIIVFPKMSTLFLVFFRIQGNIPDYRRAKTKATEKVHKSAMDFSSRCGRIEKNPIGS
jgi:hypothetical protein